MFRYATTTFTCRLFQPGRSHFLLWPKTASVTVTVHVCIKCVYTVYINILKKIIKGTYKNYIYWTQVLIDWYLYATFWQSKPQFCGSLNLVYLCFGAESLAIMMERVMWPHLHLAITAERAERKGSEDRSVLGQTSTDLLQGHGQILKNSVGHSHHIQPLKHTISRHLLILATYWMHDLVKTSVTFWRLPQKVI